MSTAQDQSTVVVVGYPVEAYQAGTGQPDRLSRAASNQATRPAPNNDPERSKDRERLFILNFISNILLILVLVLAFIFLIGAFILLTEDAEFKVELQSATMSQLNVTATFELTATWDMTFLVTNPEHRHRLSIKTGEAWLLYGDDDKGTKLDLTPLLPFDVNKRNQTRVDVKLSAVSQWVGDEVGKEISDDRSRGIVSFQVKVLVCAKYEFFMSGEQCNVNCDDVAFRFSPNGTATLIEVIKQRDLECSRFFGIRQKS